METLTPIKFKARATKTLKPIMFLSLATKTTKTHFLHGQQKQCNHNCDHEQRKQQTQNV